MDRKFAAIAFSDAAKKLQEISGSRAAYAGMEKETRVDGLTQHETAFIAGRDSFYIASAGENGFPYIQHRGGPPGFLKVLDAKRIGFIDFKGNMQYITTGNIATNNNVAIIMVDYPSRARLKIFARAEVVTINDNPDLYALLDLNSYRFRPEQMIVLHIEAYDWNCPQHITPRYTLQEIEAAFSTQTNQVAKLEEQIKILRAKLKEAGIK